MIIGGLLNYKEMGGVEEFYSFLIIMIMK